MSDQGSVANRYQKLSTKRDFYIRKAKENALLTIPSLFPDEDTNTGEPKDLPSPYSNFGAWCVESISSKFLTSTFPPNQAFFRYEISEASLDEARVAGASDAQVTQLKLEAAKALAYRERSIGKFFDQSNLRVVVAEAFRHLVVGGNCLLHLPTDGTGARLFTLSRYVVRRGPMGRILEIIAEESFDYDGLPANVRELSDIPEGQLDANRDTEVKVYTHLQLDVDTKRFMTKQEAFGKTIPGSEGFAPEANCPFIPVRFTTVEGEDYGRGYCESYIGSLRSLEVLRRAILEHSAAAAKTLFMVRPNGSTRIRNLARSENCGFVTGDANDVSVLRIDKASDLSVASNSADTLTKELAQAFLLESSYQRDSERVTATEIRQMAASLEATQAGIWSTLSRTLQLPIVTRIETILEKSGEITPLPKDAITPTVVGGLAAIGRDSDLNKLRELTADFANAASIMPDIVQYLDTAVVAEKIVLNHSVPADGLLKTPEQVAEENQAAQQQAMQQQMISEASKAAPNVIEGAMAAGGEGEPVQ